jgi:hypothetical protein
LVRFTPSTTGGGFSVITGVGTVGSPEGPTEPTAAAGAVAAGDHAMLPPERIRTAAAAPDNATAATAAQTLGGRSRDVLLMTAPDRQRTRESR